MSVPATVSQPVAKPQQPTGSLVQRFAERYGVDAGKLLNTLKATCFNQKKKDGTVINISDEQMMSLLVVADQYKLNPFTREIYAFPANNGIVPIVSVDGWCRIINEHPQMDGIEFEPGPLIEPVIENGKLSGVPVNEYITCVIYRKDRNRPIKVAEYIVECRRNSEPWNTCPRRMLRHKALIQCARVAFGFAGIYDEEEGAVIADGSYTEAKPAAPKIQTGRVKSTQAVITNATPPVTAPVTPPADPVSDFIDNVDEGQVAPTDEAEVIHKPGEDAELPPWVVTVMNEIDNSPKVSTTESIGNRIYTEYRSEDTPEPDKKQWYPLVFMAWAERIGNQCADADKPRILKKLESWRPNLGSIAANVFASFTKGTES